MERWFRTLLVVASVSFYSLMAPFGYAFFAILSYVPTRAPARRALLLQAIVWRAFGLFHDWLRAVRILDFNPRALRAQLPGGTYLLVANHPTLTDATALLATAPRLCTAVRSDVFRKPWLRPLLAASRHFDAGEGNPLGAEVMVNAAVARLAEGFRVLIFPEGTRSPRRGLRRFGRSAFEAACRANVPIVAVLIRERPEWLGKGGRPLFGPPAALPVKRLEVLKVLSPADFSGDSRQIRDYIEKIYRERLAVAVPEGSVLGALEPGNPVPKGPVPQEIERGE
jgi:1-acyl-sn-glycerol-3-phosphate acyltransferase